MKITDVLDVNVIAADLQASDKTAVLAELAGTLTAVDDSLDHAELLQILLEREQLGSTGIGDGVAIPHGKLKDVERLKICFGRHRRGVDFDAMDGQPAHLFFLLIAPEDAAGVHLKALARISKLLKNAEVRGRLLAASGAEMLYRIIVEEDGKL